MIVEIFGLKIDVVKEMRKRIPDLTNEDYIELLTEVAALSESENKRRGLE